ncbi:MAG TPA: ShlB/FhaC/HecB family hemolysin secretion/activation protein [Candidatus Methylomirabilis sp.]|nr:ShlB/FhaC/HecB family hemolysin secretion/activation protein [Candidatus Methylomirabilis sp.]
MAIAVMAMGLPYTPAHAQVPPGRILPPLPPPLPERELLPRARVFVREIRIIGNTVLSPEELAAVTAPYTNRELSAEDLEALRVALTLLYVNKGYVNSGAILPDQTVVQGVITYQVIEGNVTAIEVTGNKWFRTGYLRDRIALSTGPPLNVNDLQERIQLLLEDPRIRRLNAELKPGLKPGDSVLDVRVEDRIPFRVAFTFDNYQSPAVGAEEYIGTIEDVNLTGNGDVLSLSFGGTSGLFPILDFKYTLPFTVYDTALFLQYRNNASVVIRPIFAALNIESTSDIYTIGLRQPVYRTLSTEIALELLGEYLAQETKLLGERFDLVPGSKDGEIIDTALRFVQEFVYRSQDYVLAARSRVSAGVASLGATINPPGIPDSRFWAWLGQFQWVQRLPIQDMYFIFRNDYQVASDRLPALEQFALGGRYTVRGYEQNIVLSDNALVASLEARVPLVRNSPWADYLELAPFIDYGYAWGLFGPDKSQSLLGVGVGLRWGLTIPWTVPIRGQFEFYWGYPTINKPPASEQQGWNLQQDGIYLQFILSTAF